MNKKLTDKQRKEIVISHYLDNSTSNIEHLMKEYNISKQGLYNVINHKDSVNYIKEYTPNLNKKLEKIITTALERLDASIQQEDIKALDLTKIIGIIYDKMRLENNLSTSNHSVNININIER